MHEAANTYGNYVMSHLSPLLSKNRFLLRWYERRLSPAFYLALVNMDIENRKFRLSYLWEPISLLIVAFVLGSVWGALLDQDSKHEYIVYVLAGFCIWGFMTSSIDAASNVFSRAHDELVVCIEPISVHVMSRTVHAFLYFLLSLPAIILFSFFWSGVDLIRIVWLPGFLAIVFLIAYMLIYALGLLCFFFTDLVRVIRLIMRMAFLGTPVIWHVEMLGDNSNYVYLNPFFPFLDTFRAIVSNHTLENYSLLAFISVTLLIYLLYFITRETLGKRLINRACLIES